MMPTGKRTQSGAEALVSEFEHPSLGHEGFGRVRSISGLYTNPSARRRGDARYLMCELCVEADQEKTVLILEPKAPEDGPLDDMSLQLFYRRFGFIKIQDKPNVLMARQPR